MNGSPSRTRSSLRVLVGDRLGFLLAEPPVDQVAGDACEAVALPGLAAGTHGPPCWAALRAAAGRPAAGACRRRVRRPAAPGRPGPGGKPDRSTAARPTSGTRSGPRGRAASCRSRSSHRSLLCVRRVSRHYAVDRGDAGILGRWQRKSTAVRAQSALAVIKQHPGMVLFARVARARRAGRRVVVVRRGLGGAAAGRAGARRGRRGPDEAQLSAADVSHSFAVGESRPSSAVTV